MIAFVFSLDFLAEKSKVQMTTKFQDIKKTGNNGVKTFFDKC